MKKNIFKSMLLAAFAMGIAACSSDPVGPEPTPEYFSYGAFVVNSGNQTNKINGTLDYIEFGSNTIINNVFEKVNGRSLGITANDAFVYGSKLYIAVDSEQLVEVVDAKTLQSLKQIQLDGAARHLTACEGKMFVSSYSGDVCRIDTTSLTVDKTIKVGDYPEGMATYGNLVFVTNSGYGSGHTFTVIDGTTGNVTGTHECPTNPTDIVCDGNYLYLLTAGTYKADWSGYEEDPAIYRINPDYLDFPLVAKGTAVASNFMKLYSFNANYYNPDITYRETDTNSGMYKELDLSKDIKYPCAIAADPITGHLWVSSYNLSEYGYADYSAPGYIVEYDSNMNKLHEYNTGVGPIAIAFFNNLK